MRLTSMPVLVSMSAMAGLRVWPSKGLPLKLAGTDASLRVVRSVLGRSNKTYPTQGDIPYRGPAEELRFDGVSLTHAGAAKPSLSQASFTIRRAATTAIVGPSGAGKTTIVNLLLGLYEPDAGTIWIGRTPLGSLDRPSWLSRIAVAGQDVELIEGTIAKNIAMARPDARRKDIEDAAALAGILDFVTDLPEQFDTWIGERGLNVSGGQRQRIGLARALICDPDLLILDEATSALEVGLEQEIRRQRFAGRTLILITHRTNSLSAADHIIRLDQGRVVDEGPSNRMAANDGRGPRVETRQSDHDEAARSR